MKVLVLGNGFDLYHKLPTRYLEFMHVVKRLKELGEDYNCFYSLFSILLNLFDRQGSTRCFCRQ